MPPAPALAPARVRTRGLVIGGRRRLLWGAGPGPTGEAEDLVVLEAGLGAGGASWGAVLEGVGGSVRAVAQDRAGYGGSAPVPGPRDLGALAADLDALVTVLLAERPHRRLVLVGHSLGGPVVRTVAASLRDRGASPAGVVLVDPSDELADMYFTPAVDVMNRVQGHAMVVLDRLHLLGRVQRAAAAGLPAAVREQAAAAVSTRAAARTVREESAHITRGLQHLRLDPPRLTGVPVTVISGRRPEGLGRRLRDELTAAHRARAAQEGGRFVAAEDSGHVVPTDQPALVVEEVLRLLR